MTTTSNYQLSQWSATDQVKRTDFNADNQKIDAALKAVQTEVGKKAKVAYGTYTGTGKYGSANPNHLDFASTLGEAPKLLIVGGPHGSANIVVVKGMTEFYPIYGVSAAMIYLTWTSTGVSWYNVNGVDYQFSNLMTYYYVAIA